MPFGGIQQIVDGLTRDDSVCLTNLFEQNAILPDQVVTWSYPNSSETAIRRTLLQIAAYYGSVGCMRTLLGRGAAVNCVSVDDGKTALDCALEGNSARMLEAVRMLLENGATLDAGSAAGLGVAQPKQELVRAPSSDLTKPCYQTDGFRMYGFKIAECTKAAAHDWTECPFLHPGEKARRRDPRHFTYVPEPCPDYRRGSCKRGDACGYAHGVFEAWLHPSKYRTQLCKDGLACSRHTCFFAHHLAELRAADAPACDMESRSTPPSPTSPTTSSTFFKDPTSTLSPTSSLVRRQFSDDISSIIPNALIPNSPTFTPNPNVFTPTPAPPPLLDPQQQAQSQALSDAIMALAGLQLLGQAAAASAAPVQKPDACGLLNTNNFVSQPFGGFAFQQY